MSAGPARSRSGGALRAAAVFADDKVAQGALSMSECPSRGHRPARRLREESRLVLRGHQRLRSEHHTALAVQHSTVCKGPSLVDAALLPPRVRVSDTTSRDVYRSPRVTDDERGDVWWPVPRLLLGHGAGLPIGAPGPQRFCSVDPAIQHQWTDPSSQT